MIYKKMKILFIGTVKFSYEALNVLLKKEFEVVGLVTKEKSKFNSDFFDLTPLAKENSIPCFFRSPNNEEECISFIKERNPCVIYCFGWSHLLPKQILSLPPFGVIGFHPSELPNNRGRHPIVWALFLGLKETASTFFVMDEGADTGDIISQKKISINPTDTASGLYKKITSAALDQIELFSNELQENSGNIPRTKQNLNEGNSWRKRGVKDGRIDFRMSTQAILNLIKSLTHPYIGAHVEYLDNEVKVWSAKEENCDLINYEPGKVLEVFGSDLVVKTYDGAVRLLEHEFNSELKKGDYL